MEEAIYVIRFHYLVRGFYFPDRINLKRFLFSQFSQRGKKVEAINYIFCNDAYLLRINKEYLSHNTLTDIITFELSAKGQPLIADIYISVERIKENAELFKNTFSSELIRVIFHGALHLMGHQDKTSKQKASMRKLEDELLSKFKVSRNTVSSRN